MFSPFTIKWEMREVWKIFSLIFFTSLMLYCWGVLIEHSTLSNTHSHFLSSPVISISIAVRQSASWFTPAAWAHTPSQLAHLISPSSKDLGLFCAFYVPNITGAVFARSEKQTDVDSASYFCQYADIFFHNEQHKDFLHNNIPAEFIFRLYWTIKHKFVEWHAISYGPMQ